MSKHYGVFGEESAWRPKSEQVSVF